MAMVVLLLSSSRRLARGLQRQRMLLPRPDAVAPAIVPDQCLHPVDDGTGLLPGGGPHRLLRPWIDAEGQLAGRVVMVAHLGAHTTSVL